MNENAAPRRFQFSLRTLLVGVIAYATLWVFTYNVGGAAVTEVYQQQYQNQIDMSRGFVVTGIRRRIGSKVKSKPISKRGRLSSPVPFLICWQWQEQTGINEFVDQPEMRDYYLVIGGYHFLCGEISYPFGAPYCTGPV